MLDDGDIFEAFAPVRWVGETTSGSDASVHADPINDPENENETINESANETINESANGALTPREKRLLELIRANPSVTYQQVASALGISYTTVWRTLQAMRKAGLIAREGANKNGAWHILT